MSAAVFGRNACRDAVVFVQNGPITSPPFPGTLPNRGTYRARTSFGEDLLRWAIQAARWGVGLLGVGLEDQALAGPQRRVSINA